MLELSHKALFGSADFYNWNRIKIRYCDGSSFTGDVAAVGPSGLYLRGARVWRAIIDDLLAKGMNRAHMGILSGCSAGGLSAILHCDNFRDLLPATAKVKCVSDAGFFLNAKDISGGLTIQNFFTQVAATHGSTKNLPASCTARMRPAELCFFPQYVAQTMRTPLFIINAAYDSWQLKNILAPTSADHGKKWSDCKLDLKKCSAPQLQTVQGFRNQFLNALSALGKSTSKGMFILSCYAHCHAGRQETWLASDSPMVANTNMPLFISRSAAEVMDSGFVHRAWEKWASNNVGSSGEPLKAALLINYDPSGPSRLLSTIAEQEGIKADPIELRQFVNFVKRNKFETESFVIGLHQYLVTSIHETWFCGRCINTSKPAGEGAIVLQTEAFLLVAL
ncbi:pectinacetylesterase family protein [Tripterygium wilfordii]|uniref:Pectin acetylesterase n=1 Tax=Tripterygium wilfordii TaxID=458696 RepID=A0A7J7BVD3_TRIWF|nr:pectinacetylesterase family protein [Tripterygium wilfordii]